MTRDTTRARQASTASAPLQMVKVTIKTVTPFIVTFRGTDVPAIKLPGLTYTAGGSAIALFQEPALGPVFPTA